MAIQLNIPFIAAIPFKGQESRWTIKSQSLYYDLWSKASSSIIVSDGDYSPEKMQIRNQWMVDNCDLLIAVWDGTSGGTANCVKYAQFVRNEHIIIHPHTLEITNHSQFTI